MGNSPILTDPNKSGKSAGGKPFRVFSLDERARLNDTTGISQRRVTGLALQGVRPFTLLEGSGFSCFLRSMTNKLIRIYGRGHLHFITFSCYRRLPLLRSVRAKNVFVTILDEVRDRYGFNLVGYVAMPEHVHLLIGEPRRGTPSIAIQVLKQRVSRRLRRKRRVPSGPLNLTFEGSEDLLPRFWQRRFYDFNVWSLKKRVEKLHYMHMNPLKRTLADHPKDWPWSSFPFYSKLNRGLIRVDPIH